MRLIDVIDTAETFQEALDKISTHKPDLLFLDINMPEKNGFDLLESLDETPYVIFVTAHDQYALNAFESNALDYLLKPVNPARLEEAVRKALKIIRSEHSSEPKEKAADEIDPARKIFIKDGNKCYFVPVQEIMMIESMGNYARIFYKDKKPLLHKSLNYLDEKLPSSLFFRANRQQMINLNFIREIHPYFNSTLQLEMENGERVDISQRQTVKFKELTGI